MNDAISRQAAIDALHTWFRDGFEEDKWWNSTHVLAALEGVPSAQRWIPCSESLPDEDLLTGTGKQYSADVLMTVFNTIDDETIIDYGHTIDGEWYSDTTDCYIPHGWKVIAWMPLPEPYKGEQE